MKHTLRGASFFDAYSSCVLLCNVKRSGFITTGVYGINPSFNDCPFFKNPIQSDSEHCDSVKTMITLLSMFYPSIVNSTNFIDFQFIAMIHELGELESGDILDDGSSNRKQKNTSEFKFIRKYLREYFPETHAQRGIRLFSEFQKHNTVFGRDAYLIDKVDAILRNLLYEKEGHPGSMQAKDKYFGSLSDQDRECCLITGSDLPADNWLCSLLLNGAGKYEHIETFIEIIRSAAYVVRGTSMEWLDNTYLIDHNH